MAVPEIADDHKSLKKKVIGKKIPPPSPPIYLTKWKITIYLITLFLPYLSLGGRHVLKLGHGRLTLTYTGHTWGLSLPMLHSWFLELLHAHPYTTHHCVLTSFVYRLPARPIRWRPWFCQLHTCRADDMTQDRIGPQLLACSGCCHGRTLWAFLQW